MGKLLEFLKSKSSKIFSQLWDKILFIETLGLLFFIPLYPKIPLLDIKNTWVYVRAEDFVVLFVLLSWIALLIKKKITLKTPLTIQIFIFWIIGGIATLHGVLLIFPTLKNVYFNVAILSLIRHIEYMSLFFIAFQGMNDKRFLKTVIVVLVTTLLGVIFYGFGQKFLSFPAYLTMNEEFAKGIPIQLSQLSRVPSTFAGHYDLAAYLVFIIPIFVSLVFGFKNWIVKIILLSTSLLGFILLFMTVSRVSFLVLFISLFIVLFFQKRKLVLFLVPVVVILFIGLLGFQSSLFDRFKSTVSEVDVLVDAHTGESLGHVNIIDKEYFKDKIVLQRKVRDSEELAVAIREANKLGEYSSTSVVFPYKFIPKEVALLNPVNVSTGENLPQGTGYINLYLSPVSRKVSNFFYEPPPSPEATSPAQILAVPGNFIIKRASAYDLSFTTRFQGEWPKAIEAFKKNLLIGSGYGSVSLAVDNNYLRILGEIGILGFISFFLIFLTLGIYIKKIYSSIDSKIAKSFVLGSAAGFIGLALNAVLIDVFEASKIAFILWILAGINLRLLTLYQEGHFNLYTEIKKAVTSPYAIIVYLLLLTIILYSQMLGNYFVGDDFTWLRWVADCTKDCSPLSTITRYFTEAGGFFYRPGTKIYFYLMHHVFWLNQVVYHLVSLFLHFVVASLFFLLAKKILKNNFLAAASSFLFLIISGYTESVFWISSTGYLFNAVFGLLGLLFFITWEEKRKFYYFLASFFSLFFALLFHELGVIFPLLVLAYKLKDNPRENFKNIWKRLDYLLLFIPVTSYLLMRAAANSHWFSGDYSYNIFKLPFNFIGNLLGYTSIILFGNIITPIFQTLRLALRENIIFVVVLIPILMGGIYLIYRTYIHRISKEDLRIVTFGLLFFAISLLPFLGLGNMTSRYSYLASMGIILILVLVLKRVYEHLQIYGKDIALCVISIFVIVFTLLHIIQIQQAYFDWRGAGDRSKKFFVSIENIYTNVWSEGNTELHFVDVPTRVGQAWIFPVGLEDAIWFAFKDDSIKIFKHIDVSSAIKMAGYSKTSFVLQFTESGIVAEIDHPLAPSNLIMP